MATDIFSLREKDKPLPIEQQDIPPDADSQWAIDYEAVHGYTPTEYDRDRRDWSLRFASQYGRTPERADWERNYYQEQTGREKAVGKSKPEFVARPSSGVDRSRTGELIVPFPWQADESGAETDMTARFRQYDRWDSQRGQYARGTPEWNTLTTAMNQLQTPTAPWYFSFAKKFGLRDEVLQVAGNRTGQDRVSAIANWIRQKQAQGVDPFNQADPYSAAYKAQAAASQAQATSASAGYQFSNKDPEVQAALQNDLGLLGAYPGLSAQPPPPGQTEFDIGAPPTGPRFDELRPGPVRFPELEGDTSPIPTTQLTPTITLENANLPLIAGTIAEEVNKLPDETIRAVNPYQLGLRVTDEVLFRLSGLPRGAYRPYEAVADIVRDAVASVIPTYRGLPGIKRAERNIANDRALIQQAAQDAWSTFERTQGPAPLRRELGIGRTPPGGGGTSDYGQPEEGPIGAGRYLPTGPVTTGTGPGPGIPGGQPGGGASDFREGPVPVPAPSPLPGTPETERIRWDPNVTMVLDRAVNDWRLLRDARDPDMSTAYPIRVIQSRDALSSWNSFLQSAINQGR